MIVKGHQGMGYAYCIINKDLNIDKVDVNTVYLQE